MKFQGHERIEILSLGRGDAVTGGIDKTEAGVVGRVSEEKDSSVPQEPSLLKGVPDEASPDPLLLKRRKDTHRAQAEEIMCPAVITFDHGAGEHDMACKPALCKSDEIKVGKECGSRTDLMDDEMLIAARLVDIPEGFPGEVFRLKVVSGCFASDHDLHAVSFCLFHLRFQNSEKTKKNQGRRGGSLSQEIKLEMESRKGIVPVSDNVGTEGRNGRDDIPGRPSLREKREDDVKEKIRVRFAPSPTGYLHIGGVRTALYNYLYARRNGGEFLLRIEDTDRERSTQESLDQILDAMTWLGLDWDGELTYQSQRLDLYRSLAEELVARGKAYYCDCTKDELDARKKALESQGVFVGYDGRCRERGLKKGEASQMVIRLKVDNGEDLSYTDLIRGEINFDSKEIDDFILIRSDGFPTYNFAVVVDDHAMGITHVLRGDDHIINTPKQVAIYRALEYETPRFGHFSMILGSDKSRLSKRHGATSVSEYRHNGFLPSALLNYLAKLGWGHGDTELFTKDELIAAFSLEGVNKAPAVFSPDKLLWVNQEHIKMLSYDVIAPYLRPFLEKRGIDPSSRSEEWFRHALETLRGRVKTLEEMADKLLFYFVVPEEWEAKDVAKAMKKSSPELLRDYADALDELDDFSVENLERHMTEYCESRSLNMGSLAQPLRLAVTGTTVSPGIHDVLCLMGKDETLARVRAFLAQL